MSTQTLVIASLPDRQYEQFFEVLKFDEQSGDYISVGSAEYLWTPEGWETNDPTEAVKATIDGEELTLNRTHMIKVEITQNSLWPED